jgi:4-hydroxy-2-oxoheptanedioate aldolase
MRENRLLDIWKNGGYAVNGWLQLPSSFSAEVMAHQGWDSLTIDLQHGLIDYQAAVPMLQAISTTSVVPITRVPWNDPAIIMKMLDAGCYAIICPMINTRAEAEAFVGACRYPPRGYRSFGPTRAAIYAGADYAEEADRQVIAVAMIETARAVENIDEILSVPGLDTIYIGPADLSQSMGCLERSDPVEPRLVAALDTILAAARRHGVVAGIHCGSPDYAARMVGKGVQFVTVLADWRLMAAASRATIAAIHDGVGKETPAEQTTSARGG